MKIEEIFPELIEMLKAKYPELVQLYMQRYIYATDPNISPVMRWHNKVQIYKTYLMLKNSNR